MTTRSYKIKDVAKALDISWKTVERLRSVGVLPGTAVLLDGKKAMFFNVGQCKKYYHYYLKLVSRDVPRCRAYKGVRTLMAMDGVTTTVRKFGKKKVSPQAIPPIPVYEVLEPSVAQLDAEETEQDKERAYKAIAAVICLGLLGIGALVLSFVLLKLK